MESETPPLPDANTPEQKEEEIPFDARPFRWNAMIAPPWDPGTYYFFLMPDQIFYEAELIGYSLDFAKNFQSAMAHFCAAASYAGLHKTIDRISEDIALQGQEAGEATLLATLAVQLVQYGVLHFLPDFVHVLIHAEADKEKRDSFVYPTSPMHAWAFVQACEYLEKDILPLFEFKDGGDAYPFGEVADVKQAAQAARKFLSVEIAKLMEGVNPYKQIADLRSIGEMIEKQSQQSESSQEPRQSEPS